MAQKRNVQKEILERFFDDAAGLETIQDLLRGKSVAVLKDRQTYAMDIKGPLFEALALASLGERPEQTEILENFLLGILREPDLLLPVISEAIFPKDFPEKDIEIAELLNRRGIAFTWHIQEVTELLTREDLSENHKKLISQYLNFIKQLRREFKSQVIRRDGELHQAAFKNNDGLAINVEHDPKTNTRTAHITGLLEAKAHSEYTPESIGKIKAQRREAPQALYTIVQILSNDALAFYLEQLGLSELLPQTITCLEPKDLSYTLLHAENATGLPDLKERIENVTTQEVPFNASELYALARYILISVNPSPQSR